MPSLPTGTITFLFTDIEGSTALLQHLGDRRFCVSPGGTPSPGPRPGGGKRGLAKCSTSVDQQAPGGASARRGRGDHLRPVCQDRPRAGMA